MSMHNSAHSHKSAVYLKMSRSIRRRIIPALYLISLKIHKYHIIRSKLVIIDSARFYRKDALLSVDLACVAPCECDKIILRQHHIRLIDTFLKFFKHVSHTSALRFSTAARSIERQLLYRFMNLSNPSASLSSGSIVSPSIPAKTSLSRKSSRLCPSLP